jgi:formylglycine-generating enzyme required for sulfatase activity
MLDGGLPSSSCRGDGIMRVAGIVLFAASVAACGARTVPFGVDDGPPDDAGPVPPACPIGLPGPALVPIAGTAACIDATEVTNEDYAAFLASGSRAKPLDCAAKQSVVPAANWPAPPERARHPVVDVDWCDAVAYCTWAGKRLCAAPDGAPGDLARPADPRSSAWFAACSGGGERTYPYGDAYDPAACNGLDLDAGRALPVGSLPRCEARGAFDLSGNVWEWEDACTSTDTGRVCLVRGGGFRNDRYNVTCSGAYRASVDTTYDYYGFRCCTR